MFYDALLARDNPMKVDVPQVQHLLSTRPFCLTAMRQDIQKLLVEWKNALLAPSASCKNDSISADTTKGTAQDTSGSVDRSGDEDESTEPPTLDSTDNVARRNSQPKGVGRLGQRGLAPIPILENAPRGPPSSSSCSDDTSSTSSRDTVEMRFAVSSGSGSRGESSTSEETLTLEECETAAERDNSWVDDEEEGSGPEHELGTIAPQPESTLKFACEKSPRAAGRLRQGVTALSLGQGTNFAFESFGSKASTQRSAGRD
jgi:hypothetical protein